jgi:hypothetical protein
MIENETIELLDTERLRDDGGDTIVAFMSYELDMSKIFAKRAWSLCSTGHLDAAKLQGIAAIDAGTPQRQTRHPYPVNRTTRHNHLSFSLAGSI